MELAVNPSHFKKAAVWEQDRTLIEAIGLVSEAGFKHLDIGTADRAEAEEIAAYAADKGLSVIQSHMPFNRYKRADYAVFSKELITCAESAKLLGSNILVVHGDEFDFANCEYTPEAALEFNYRFFTPLVDFAAKNNMKVAFECVFNDWWPKERPRFCSKTEELCALTDKFGADTVGICWDSGHAKVEYGKEHISALKTAGDRVIATHIHDNYYGKDLHLFPFMGDTDWPEFMSTLKNVGYNGDFTFELVYDRLPNALAPEYVKLLCKSGKYLLDL